MVYEAASERGEEAELGTLNLDTKPGHYHGKRGHASRTLTGVSFHWVYDATVLTVLMVVLTVSSREGKQLMKHLMKHLGR